ncbi:MAG: N-methyl-L-tryptophan oxidase [Bacteroidetes bacterium]|nr:N-methyl-L-tryptophan oxidase [Bacteroidota bacterium]MBS1932013.1 N-methyl-L-tryptophan oxidase [Bacteroidota bacterium]
MKAQTNFDVIVLGVGSMGSATCYHLTKRGINILGLEQFDIPHEHGSHWGQSRIIRKAYFEHSDYVPLLQRAYKNWKHLEKISGRQVYFQTGLLYFGLPEHQLIQGVQESARKYNIKIKELSEREMKSTYPRLKIPDTYKKLLEPEAGFLIPERAIHLYVEQAKKNGAVIKTKVKVLDWEKQNNGILVKTADAVYSAKKLIITAGAWASKLIPDLSGQLRITKQTLAWIRPNKPSLFKPGNFPCWLLAEENKRGAYYGFPVVPANEFNKSMGLKLAYHFAGATTDPDNMNRKPSKKNEASLIHFLNTYFPGTYKSTIELKSCMYTNSSDENFIIDFLPGYNNDVLFATGFSGHGFKFASVVGEIMSDLATEGKTRLPINFLRLNRFKKNS